MRLNDELFQWRLRAEKEDGQVEKMRSDLDAKDAEIRELQQRLDNEFTVGSAMMNAATYHVLSEALKTCTEGLEASEKPGTSVSIYIPQFTKFGKHTETSGKRRIQGIRENEGCLSPND